MDFWKVFNIFSISLKLSLLTFTHFGSFNRSDCLPSKNLYSKIGKF